MSPPAYTELDHPADLYLQIDGTDIPELFANALFALYDNLVELDGFREREESTVEVEAATLPEALRSLLSEALYSFATEGFVAVKSQVAVETRDTGAVRASARLRGERADRSRHVLLAEIKAVTYHKLTVEPAPEGGWQATVLLDV